MEYIIEKVPLLKNGQFEKVSLLVKNNRIHSMRKHFPHDKKLRMNTQHFVMTPIYVLSIPSHSIPTSIEEQKHFFIEKVIQKGSTFYLTYVDIIWQFQFHTTLKNLQMKLLNCPVDYAIAVKIPLRLLTVEFIRKCKKEKISAIFVDLHSGDLSSVPWGWIREALFPFNCPLIPYMDTNKTREKIKKLKEWKKIMEEQKLPSLKSPLDDFTPIPFPDLVKLGFYPVKFGIHQGGEVSYNLYVVDETECSNEQQLYYHFQEKLAVTVHKGAIIKAGDKIKYRPGFGEHIIIQKPAFFQLTTEALPFIYVD